MTPEVLAEWAGLFASYHALLLPVAFPIAAKGQQFFQLFRQDRRTAANAATLWLLKVFTMTVAC